MKGHMYTIRIGWLYPELMSTYGDRGNILYFRRRCEQYGIKTELIPIDFSFSEDRFGEIDFIFGGGSQDTEQELVMRDLQGKKAEEMKKKIENNVPALFVCGSPQLVGKSYEPGIGKKITGLGVFDMESVHPGPSVARCIGNTVGEVLMGNIGLPVDDKLIIGFENHGGRSYLGKGVKPFAKVIKGYGNNAKDGLEGMVYKNAIGCYYHGPFFPKNPSIADFFIRKIIRVKHDEKIELRQLPDFFEKKAREILLNRWNLPPTR